MYLNERGIMDNNSKIKILIADGSIAFRTSLRKMLNTIAGNTFCFYEASDGIEAIEVINKSLPDLIFTDKQMPFFDGIDLILKIKEDHRFNPIPIILMTDEDGLPFRDILPNYENLEFMSKPFSTKELVEKVFRLLKLNWDIL